MERGALSLAEAVSRAEENVLRAEADMEALVGERLLYYSHLIGAASEWFCCGLLIMCSRSLCAALTTPWTNLALNCGLNTATIRCSYMRRYSSKYSAGRLAAEDDLW
jgi:hypothetical protein